MNKTAKNKIALFLLGGLSFDYMWLIFLLDVKIIHSKKVIK